MSRSISRATRSRSRWLIPSIVALVAFIGGVASNLMATDLEAILPSHTLK